MKLIERPEKSVLEAANGGGQIFANLATADGIKRKSFSVIEKIGSSPTFMTMYVANDGYLTKDDPQKCRVMHVAPKTKDDGSVIPEVVEHEATIVGMLRYEYALEIQSRHVAAQSRIGLDFESHKAEEPDEKAS